MSSQDVLVAWLKDAYGLTSVLVGYAAENVEVASYSAPVSAAQSSGDSETASICWQILQEGRAMARWLEQSLPALVWETMGQTVASGV